MQPKLCLCLAGGLVFAALFTGNPFLSRGDGSVPMVAGAHPAAPPGDGLAALAVPSRGASAQPGLVVEAGFRPASAATLNGTHEARQVNSSVPFSTAAPVCPNAQIAADVVDAWQLANGEWVWLTSDGRRYRRNRNSSGRAGEPVVIEIVGSPVDRGPTDGQAGDGQTRADR